MGLRDYSGAAVSTVLSSPLSSGATTATIEDATGWPTGGVGPFYVTIGRGSAVEERILVSSRAGTVLTIQARGQDGTSDSSHTSGDSVEHTLSAVDLAEANSHVNASSGVHGISGALFGTSQTVTLTNKTMSGASNSFSDIPQSAVTGLVSALASFITQAAADVRYALASQTYTIAEVDADFAAKADYYDKTASDARYPLASGVYTKAEADSAFLSQAEGDARYPLASNVYDKTAADARYVEEKFNPVEAQITSSVTGIVGTDVDVVEATSVTVDGSTKVRVGFTFPSWASTVEGDRIDLKIKDGTTQIAQITQRMNSAAGGQGGGSFFAVHTPTAGSHTYKVTAVRVSGGTGTLTVSANTNQPCIITVEQFGD
jgi:hypothetical protein